MVPTSLASHRPTRPVRLVRTAPARGVPARVEPANAKEEPKLQYAVGEEDNITDGAITTFQPRSDTSQIAAASSGSFFLAMRYGVTK